MMTITKMLGLAICTMIFAGCQPNKKSNTRLIHVVQTTTEGKSIEHHITNEIIANKKDKLSQDSIYMILYGAYSLPDSIGNRLPANAKDYFLKVNFPYRLPKDLHIDYFCETEDFQIEDLFIFKTKNDHRTCEYIALIDTFPFIEIIARKCDEMENWIVLYVLNENYKIVASNLLLNTGGEMDEPPLKFDNKNIQFIDQTDTLTYSNRQYKIITDEIFEITDASGKSENDIGVRRLKLFTINEKGKIVEQRDSVIYKKEYYDLFWNRND